MSPRLLNVEVQRSLELPLESNQSTIEHTQVEPSGAQSVNPFKDSLKDTRRSLGKGLGVAMPEQEYVDHAA